MANPSLPQDVGCWGWAEWPITACPDPSQVECCGWVSFYNWTENSEIRNSTETLYPCSCEVTGEEDNRRIVKKGFCEGQGNSTQGQNLPEEWPVYQEVCWGGAGWGPPTLRGWVFHSH